MGQVARLKLDSDDERVVLVDDLEVKSLAVKYRLTMGQVRGLIARYGLNAARLDMEAERLRRC